MIEPARDEAAIATPDVRVGSATNAVRPILAAERSLAAGAAQWISLLAVASAALVADQLTKQVVASQLALDAQRQQLLPQQFFVLGLYGEADQGIPVAQVEAMKAALASAGKTAEFKIYPGAPHGFHADYRPSYRKEAADDAWAQMTAWFKKNGGLS